MPNEGVHAALKEADRPGACEAEANVPRGISCLDFNSAYRRG